MNIDQSQSRQRPDPLIQDLLHALGQPMTSLQMCVLLRDRPSLDPKDVTTCMHEMADQVTLLSRLFETLRRLLDSEPPPRITADKLERLLLSILPQWQKAVLQRDITLISTGFPTIEPLRQARSPGDLIETCLQDIFAAALESTPDQGSITVTLVPRSDATPFQFRILGGTLLSPASFAAHFALPTAQTLLASDNQEFTYSLNPFAANLVLLMPAVPITDAATIAPPRSAGEDRAGHPG